MPERDVGAGAEDPVIGDEVCWRARRNARARTGRVVAVILDTEEAMQALQRALGRAPHPKEIRFAASARGPCLIAQSGFTGSKYFCGYFVVRRSMLKP
jgi:hypothetical protein